LLALAASRASESPDLLGCRNSASPRFVRRIESFSEAPSRFNRAALVQSEQPQAASAKIKARFGGKSGE
jgi:hypothetical protein